MFGRRHGWYVRTYLVGLAFTGRGSHSMSHPSPRKVVLDTDIGSDVDDLLALAMLLGSPEWELAAVSTVYGDTVLRARIVRRAYRLAGRAGGNRHPRAPDIGSKECLAGGSPAGLGVALTVPSGE
jgi:hypothetical protein